MEGITLFDEDLDLHLLMGMVPGDQHLIPITPKEIEASIEKHLRCITSISPHLFSLKVDMCSYIYY